MINSSQHIKSISVLLEESLDIIGADIPARDAGLNTPQLTSSVILSSHSQQGDTGMTASKLLLHHIRSSSESTELKGDYIAFDSKKQMSQSVNPLMQQIADSTVGAPKYWGSAKNSVASRGPSAVKAKGSKQSIGKFTGRAAQERREKGEEYKDKLLQKMMASSRKSKLRQKGKGNQ